MSSSEGKVRMTTSTVSVSVDSSLTAGFSITSGSSFVGGVSIGTSFSFGLSIPNLVGTLHTVPAVKPDTLNSQATYVRLHVRPLGTRGDSQAV